MTSSARARRSARPCSPSAQRSASARLLLPDPLGPTTALIPGPNSTRVRSANDLKPAAGARAGAPGRLTRRRRSASADGARAGSPPSASSAAAAAAVSATTPRRPSPRSRRRSPADDTSTTKCAGGPGPRRPRRRYSGRSPVAPLRELLEPALGALEAAERRVGVDLGRGQRRASQSRAASQPRSRKTAPRAPRSRTRGAPGARARRAAASPSPSSRSSPRSMRAAETGEAGRGDDRRPTSREEPLVVVRVALVERLRDHQADDGVAEELEPLVVPGASSGCSWSQLPWTSACSSRRGVAER